MDPIRIACVRYLNTAVLIEGLSKLPEVQVIPTVPSRIADMVRAGEADIGLVSLIDAAQQPAGAPTLTLLPVGMIGCDGPTLTVRLYASIPLERVTTIHADTDSHTSVMLSRILMKRRFDRDVTIRDFNAREQMPVWLSGGSGTEDGTWPKAMLLIGDKVVTDSPPAIRYPHQLDLGEAWKAHTGMPFVYAMWACRTGEESTERVRTATDLLLRQLRHNLTRIDWIITRRAGEHRWPTDLARQYLGHHLRFVVGTREQQAAERFIAEASDLGLLGTHAAPLRWSAHAVDLAAPTPTG